MSGWRWQAGGKTVMELGTMKGAEVAIVGGQIGEDGELDRICDRAGSSEQASAAEGMESVSRCHTQGPGGGESRKMDAQP